MRFAPLLVAALTGCGLVASEPEITLEVAHGSVQSRFTPSAVQVHDTADTWRVDLQLAAWGRERAMVPATKVTPTQSAGRIEYGRGLVTEWYEDGILGLKQGFDVAKPPEGQGPLLLEMTVRSSHKPLLDRDGKGLYFVDRDGVVGVRYDQLVVYDATGAEVESWMSLACDRVCTVSLHVDDAGAQYPLEIDPTIWDPTTPVLVLAPTPADGERYGDAVALDGITAVASTLVVGVPGDDTDATDAGLAHVYHRDGVNWVLDATLSADTDAAAGARFGAALAIDNGRIIVGAPGADAAYIFSGSGTSWTRDVRVTGNAGSEFGHSVALAGAYALVGAPLDDTSGTDAGRAIAYRYDSTVPGWTTGEVLSNPSTSAGDQFGSGVALTNVGIEVYAFVGAPRDDDSASDAGSVSVFSPDTIDPDDWSLTETILAGDASANRWFGFSVAADGSALAVGAPTNANTTSSRAYVFTESAGSWTQHLVHIGNVNRRFGWSVDIYADNLIVGARLSSENASGSAHLFESDGVDPWAVRKDFDPDAIGDIEGRAVGDSVATFGNRAAVGAPNAYDGDADENPGAVYVIEGQNTDADGDGFFACVSLFPHTPAGCDCNDDPFANGFNIKPGATELDSTENIDENCDNLVVNCGISPKAGCSTSPVVITEMMIDPLTTVRREGQWMELRNNNTHKVDLFGAYLFSQASAPGTRQSVVTETLVVQPSGGRVVIAGSDNTTANGNVTAQAVFSPSFELDYNPSTAASIGVYEFDNVDIVPVLVPVDEVSFDANAFTTGTQPPEGASYNLDRSFTNAPDSGTNNPATRWCDARSPIPSGSPAQFGSPGTANDECNYTLSFDYTYSDPVNPLEEPFVGNFSGGTQCVGPLLSDCTRAAPVTVTFSFCPDGDTCGPFGLRRFFTTSNDGEGAYTRTTTAGGQVTEFTYRYVNNTTGPTYLAFQSFTQTCPTEDGIDMNSNPFYNDGDWENLVCL